MCDVYQSQHSHVVRCSYDCNGCCGENFGGTPFGGFSRALYPIPFSHVRRDGMISGPQLDRDQFLQFLAFLVAGQPEPIKTGVIEWLPILNQFADFYEEAGYPVAVGPVGTKITHGAAQGHVADKQQG